MKNSTGYNLTQLLIGSEGTLAIITKIIIKLIPKPKFRSLLLVPFATLEQPAEAVSALFQAGLTPSACEYMEKSALAIGCKATSIRNPSPNAEAVLLIEVDAQTSDEIDRQLEILSEVLTNYHALDIILADTSEKQNELWRIRR